MLMRTVHLKLDTDRLLELRQAYADIIIGELSHTRGCLYAGLLQSVDDPGNGISLTLWNTSSDADAYERSGAYRKLWDQSKQYLAAIPEWTVHLTDDLQLEYTPVEDEPVVLRYEAPGPTDPSAFAPQGKGRLYLRILSLHVRSGMLEEFSTLYRREIIPGLRRVPGCHSAFLIGEKGDPRKLISVTIWNSKADAEQYEHHGDFTAMNERVGYTLENSTRWKTEEHRVEHVLGSDDMTASGYTLLTGQAFEAAG